MDACYCCSFWSLSYSEHSACFEVIWICTRLEDNGTDKIQAHLVHQVTLKHNTPN